MATTDSTTTRRTDGDYRQPKTDDRKASTAKATSDTTTTPPGAADSNRAGWIGNAAPIDTDATPAETTAGNDMDAYELNPETHGPHDRSATGDI